MGALLDLRLPAPGATASCLVGRLSSIRGLRHSSTNPASGPGQNPGWCLRLPLLEKYQLLSDVGPDTGPIGKAPGRVAAETPGLNRWVVERERENGRVLVRRILGSKRLQRSRATARLVPYSG